MHQIVIKIIYDNCKESDSFQEGWGFSCLVDMGSRKILFDTGGDARAFFSNLQKLNIQCDEITDVIYSHKHWDHIAGLEEVIGKLKRGSHVFLPKGFSSPKLSYSYVEIVESFKQIDQGIYCLALRGGLFFYEQALVIETQKGLVVITGCAHPGIVRLLEEAQCRLQRPIHLALGGFHLFRKKQKQVDEVVRQFQALKVQIAAPCHCTGEKAIAHFQQVFGENFYKIGAGSVLTLDK